MLVEPFLWFALWQLAENVCSAEARSVCEGRRFAFPHLGGAKRDLSNASASKRSPTTS
jgi:hypothetical protein